MIWEAEAEAEAEGGVGEKGRDRRKGEWVGRLCMVETRLCALPTLTETRVLQAHDALVYMLVSYVHARMYMYMGACRRLLRRVCSSSKHKMPSTDADLQTCGWSAGRMMLRMLMAMSMWH